MKNYESAPYSVECLQKVICEVTKCFAQVFSSATRPLNLPQIMVNYTGFTAKKPMDFINLVKSREYHSGCSSKGFIVFQGKKERDFNGLPTDFVRNK